jgi:hypothetical protein
MIYRKRGAVVRWENGTLIRVSESGVAIEEGELFTCAPEPSSRPVVESSGVMETVRAIEAAVKPLNIERLIVSEGIAEHEFEGRTWREETFRIHCSIVNQHIRALADSSTRRLDDLHRITRALKRADQHEREPPARLILAPNVTAALLPSLVGLAPPNVELSQAAGGIDGKGNDIIEAHGEPWPNWYRPSYRVRPIRMPLNLRLRCDVTEIERDRPVAVALLAPPDGLTLRVLVVDGMDDGTSAYPATVRVTRIDAVGEETVWYPYGGGSFGAEMML